MASLDRPWTGGRSRQITVDGTEFCIIEPQNNFLTGCPRLGVINADRTRKVGLFWSEVLGWPLIWDQEEETAIRSPDGTGPIIQWSGPPLMAKTGRNRLHLDIAPPIARTWDSMRSVVKCAGACRATLRFGRGRRG